MSRLWAALARAEDSKLKDKVKDLEFKLKMMAHDVYCLMEFLEKDANEDWNRPGSSRIRSELGSRRRQADDAFRYYEARKLVEQYEEDHPEAKDRRGL